MSEDELRGILERVRALPGIGDHRYNLWLGGASVKPGEEGVIDIGLPNNFLMEQLARHGQIKDAVRKVFYDAGYEARFVVDEGLETRAKEEGQRLAQRKVYDREKTAALMREKARIANSQLKIPKDRTFDDYVDVGGLTGWLKRNMVAVSEGIRAYLAGGELGVPQITALVGRHGTGKTSLLAATYNAIVQDNEGKVVLFSGPVLKNTYSAWGSKMRKNDDSADELLIRFKPKEHERKVWIIDDVQGACNKQKTENFLREAIETHTGYGHPLVLVYRLDDDESMPLVEELLGTASANGNALVLRTRHYTNEELQRLFVTRSQGSVEGVPKEYLERIAKRALSGGTNPDRIYQLLTAIRFDEKNLGRPLEMNELEILAGDEVSSDSQKPVDTAVVLEAVAAHYGYKGANEFLRTVRGSRRQVYFEQKMVAAYLLVNSVGLPYQDAGEILGYRNHTSTMHALDAFEDRVLTAEPDAQKVLAFEGNTMKYKNGVDEFLAFVASKQVKKKRKHKKAS